MSDTPPEFKSGNRWFVSALNRVIAYSRGHGVNCIGVPGWSWTVDGWQPPRNDSTSAGSVDPWDIVAAPNTDGLFKLRSPFCSWSHGDLDKQVTVTQTNFAIAADKWVVAKALGPITTYVTTPAIEIAIVDQWEWYPSAHKFSPDNPYEWEESYLPLWKLVVEDDKTNDMVKIGKSGDDVIYGRRYVSGWPRLAITITQAVDPSRLRTVPELF